VLAEHFGDGQCLLGRHGALALSPIARLGFGDGRPVSPGERADVFGVHGPIIAPGPRGPRCGQSNRSSLPAAAIEQQLQRPHADEVPEFGVARDEGHIAAPPVREVGHERTGVEGDHRSSRRGSPVRCARCGEEAFQVRQVFGRALEEERRRRPAPVRRTMPPARLRAGHEAPPRRHATGPSSAAVAFPGTCLDYAPFHALRPRPKAPDTGGTGARAALIDIRQSTSAVRPRCCCTRGCRTRSWQSAPSFPGPADPP